MSADKIENPLESSLDTCRINYESVVDLPCVEEFFDLGKPVEVDIGSGKGGFLLAKAMANPAVQYLGIERQLARIRKIDKKARRAGLLNVRIIRLEAEYTLRYLLPEGSVRRFYLLFPDPWPKRRHRGRRLFNADFRELVRTRLVLGGDIQVVTDHAGYYTEIDGLLRGDSRFEATAAFTRKENEVTEFERIFRAQGKPIGACGYRRIS